MKINDEMVRQQYIVKYPIQQLFSAPIEEFLEVHVFEKGEYICEELMPPERLYFLVKGKVKLYMIHLDGNVSLAQYYEAGDILGELEFLGIRTQSQSIQAVEPSVCLALSFQEHGSLILSDAVFLRNLSKLIAEKMLRGVSKLVATQTYPLENRVAAYLLEKEEEVGRGNWIRVSLTDLAQYLGASSRHLFRVIKHFDEAGWIERERGRMWISNHRALEEKVLQMQIE